MKVGISTASFFTRYATEDALQAIATLGATRYEVFLSGHLEYKSDFIDELYRRQRDVGLHCTALHALGSQFEPQLFSAIERQRAGAEHFFQQVIEAAARLHAPLYVMHGSFHLKNTGWTMNHARLGRRFQELCAMTASHGVNLTLENVHWCMYNQSGFAKALSPYLDDCPLGYTLDVKQAVQSGEDVQDYLEDMGARLRNVHLCDVLCRNGTVRTCLPGRGQVDFSALAHDVKRVNPNASVTLEVYAHDYRSMEELQQSYAWLCDLFENESNEEGR